MVQRSGAGAWCLAAALCALAGAQVSHVDPVGFSSHEGTRCYDDAGRPQRCIPGFENAAFNVLVEATNTCGEERPTEFCVQTGASGTKKSCEVCTASGAQAHPAAYLTDFNNNDNQTWWQSETMYEAVQYPSQVNLTLHLRKAFDITYVRLWFYSPRPESFAIYKRTSEDGPWIPYQFYSATCRDTYGLPESSYTRKGPEETRALCTSEYSDISPLTGGNVAFSTLEGRPSAYNFDASPELQEWVTATDIRITLDRLNTFGDEVFGDQQVLRSYFYAISDFAVGARCKCNGHASECVASSSLDGRVRRVCRCEHNTAGPDCNECLPFYNDAPWGRASAQDAHECRACNCNGFSNRCFFDKDLYERTGHGGHCLDCTGNRDGPNCERCRENYFQREDNYCIACNCNEIGSRSLQCNSEGRCQCKPGVTGDKCDRCEANHYDFSGHGCKPCGCNHAGSLGNQPRCDPYSGVCQCKENVEGKRCGGCKPGYFNLDAENEFGCTPCFCYGHSSVCRSAPGYSKVEIESIFARNKERWSAQDYRGNPLNTMYNGISQSIGVSAPGAESVYFVAPDRFLGDQRASYNQDLTFKLRIGESGPSPTVEDIVLEGASLSITQAIFGQQNPLPSTATQEYKFRLHEHPHYGWQPRLTARDFMSVLSNLTAVHIRGTYTSGGVGFLDDVVLQTARRGAAGRPANWIEMCTCPDGYVGQFCESCAPGFRHEPANGGPFAPCVPCNCNGHADICDAETGRCICQHNTAGDNCERCARGYYGNSLQGTAYDCKHCPCPNQGACTQLVDETVVCLECPRGYGGPRCDLCSDGYFGDPTGRFGPVRVCQPCDCNQNVDPNAVGNCNRTTGECLKCIYNTAGRECDECMPGFYGDALAVPKGDCKQCQCYHAGTQETGFGPPVCDQLSGQCHCKAHVIGKNCDRCEDGFYNIVSGEGCQPCNCDLVGSVNHTCDLYTGQCQCRPGVTGQRCDVCEPYQYGFSVAGCKPCDCDQIGSVALQCNPIGQCPCLENVEGRQCDRCKENKYDRQRGCIDCPACYNLVQSAANAHRAKLKELEKVLSDIESNPTVINDQNFENKLKDVQDVVERLWNDAKHGAGSEDKSLLERLEELRKRFDAVGELTEQTNESTEKSAQSTKLGIGNVTQAEDIIEKASEALKDTMDYLQTDGSAALLKAMERSEQFGQTSSQMSEIAREARVLAEQQEKEADDIQLIAAKAVNTSTEAFELARDAIKQQLNISDELKELGSELERIEDSLEQTKVLAEEASETVEDINRNALKIYTDIYGLNIPEINIPKLKEVAELTAAEAQRIKQEAEDLLSDNENLVEMLRDQIEETKELLERGHSQQQFADELLADTDAAKAKAEDAVNKGDEILETAKKTLKTLQEFDHQVQESKDKAQDALGLVPEIRQLIADAENKTGDAKLALAGAEHNAQIARDTAQEAQQKYAEQASQEADSIRQGAEQTKNDAGKVRDEAQELEGQVAITANKIKDLEDLAVKDEELTTTAKNKVGQAKSKSANVTRQVEKALEDVQAIIEELNQVPHIDPALLDDLELRLQRAEDDLKTANLDGRIAELKEARISQAVWVKNYQDEVDRLQADVQNIEDISNSLPDGCWKRVQLEP
ncbi:laminin subunit gamma-1 [Periplaneta americana]|uniref:laminin subunit gamma-1 n=1 Tax=Periplaneta americana TaxID=6978 RepID=UPI0037E7E602